MNKVLIFLLLSIACFAQTGSGTEEDPYIITTPQQFSDMRNNMNAYYQLGNDLDFSEFGDFIPLPGLSTGETFHFDGMGYTISNLTVTLQPTTDNDAKAIFLAQGSGGLGYTVQNVNFDNINSNYINHGNNGTEGNKLALIAAGHFSMGGEGITLQNIIVSNSTLELEVSGSYNGSNPWTIRSAIFAAFENWDQDNTIKNIVVKECSLLVSGNVSHQGTASFILNSISSSSSGSIIIEQCAAINNYANIVTSGNLVEFGGIVGRTSGSGGSSRVILNDCYAIGNYQYQPYNSANLGNGGLVGNADQTYLNRCYVADITLDAGEWFNRRGLFIGRVDQSSGDSVVINDSYYEEGQGFNPIGVEDETVINNSVEKTETEMKTQSTYEDWDFDEVWGISPSYQDGYPFLLGNVLLVLLTPEAGDTYVIPETVEITWIGSAGSNPEVDIEYSTDGGENWNALATGVTSPYEWDFSSLGINSSVTKIKLDYNGFEVESKLFTIRALSRYIIIESPLSLPNITIGSTVTIEVETNNVDSIRIEWSKAQSNWELITKEDTDGSGVSNVSYEWTIPVGISSPFYLRAIEDLDTVIYVWDKELTSIGATMPSHPQICWKGYQSSPVRTYWSYDQCCGWCSGLDHTSVIATLKDKADGINFSLSICDGTCDNEIANFIENEDFVTIGNEVKQRRDFYPRGTTVTYKLRRYYTSSTDSTLRMDDLINDIEGIFVADLKPFINTNGENRNWTGVPSALQIYHVQQSKIEGKTYSVSFDDFESLNDEDFTPQLLIGGSYFGHGGLLLYKMDLLPEPVSANPLSDIEQVEVTGSIRRTIFRGIHPKATKKLNHEWDKN